MKIDSTNQGAGIDSLQLSKAAQEQAAGKAAEQQAAAKARATAAEPVEAVKAKTAAAGAGAGTAATDQVQLSNLSHALRAETEDTPERLAYLEELSRQVARGDYQPDSGAVAKKMVDELLGGF
jgi:anti-sigma28 factor (negative regulator of flagellin synthesis)